MSGKVVGAEIPVVFTCQGERLLAIIHPSDVQFDVGVLVIVGGPQYRVGSHRQFLLLARTLSTDGVSVMRFDVRGMGDSEGVQRRFDQLDDDIRTAIDCFLTSCPYVKRVVLWGLCDGASAALIYAYQDSRVGGMVLLNPWVLTEQGVAKTHLKHYYWQRLSSRDLWRKIASFQFDYAKSLSSLMQLIRQAVDNSAVENQALANVRVDQNLPLPARMQECLRRFSYPVLFILSGRDLTADGFRDAVKSDLEWQTLIKDARVTQHDLAEADHTFSSATWRDQVAKWTRDWVKSLH